MDNIDVADLNTVETLSSECTVKDYRFDKDDTVIDMNKCELRFVGVNERAFRSTHCSCINFRKAKKFTLSEILRKLVIMADNVYIKFKDDELMHKCKLK